MRLAEPLMSKAFSEGVRHGANLMRHDMMQLHPTVKTYDDPNHRVHRRLLDQFPSLSRGMFYSVQFPKPVPMPLISDFLKLESPLTRAVGIVHFRPEYNRVAHSENGVVQELQWVNWVLDGPGSMCSDYEVTRTIVRSEWILGQALRLLQGPPMFGVGQAVDFLRESYNEIRRLNGHFEATDDNPSNHLGDCIECVHHGTSTRENFRDSRTDRNPHHQSGS